nr:recombinase family protein [Streptococcus equi]
MKDCEIEEYIDDGFSATNTNRPSFLRLIDNIKAGE